LTSIRRAALLGAALTAALLAGRALAGVGWLTAAGIAAVAGLLTVAVGGYGVRWPITWRPGGSR
jgi:hypothetical protein